MMLQTQEIAHFKIHAANLERLEEPRRPAVKPILVELLRRTRRGIRFAAFLDGPQFRMRGEPGVAIELIVALVVLLYWVIDVDETFVAAIGYVLCGDRVGQARCDPTSVDTRG
jgi:hypothetical protein